MGGDGLVKGSVSIAGHHTSLSLEPIFWAALRSAAVAQRRPLNALIAEIDEARTTNLSSAVRVWLFEQAQRRALPSAVLAYDRTDALAAE